MRDPAAYKPSNTNAVTKLRGLKTLKVSVKHGPREMKYGITSMSREGANKLSFDYQGKQITVAQYFQQVYSKVITFKLQANISNRYTARSCRSQTFLVLSFRSLANHQYTSPLSSALSYLGRCTKESWIRNRRAI